MKQLLAFALLLTLCPPAQALEISMCKQGKKRITCIVDGDTLWLNGQKLRMRGYDTPEPYTNICGGDFERRLAAKASARFMELLNGNELQIVIGEHERKGSNRRLVDIYVGGRNVGEILVEERLARRWPDGKEFCVRVQRLWNRLG